MHNLTNPHQGAFKKILCVCSAGLLRSPTLAGVLWEKGYNTRAVGANREYALVPLDESHIYWADIIVFVNKENHEEASWDLDFTHKDVIILDIPDKYPYRDAYLMKICSEQFDKSMKDLEEAKRAVE